MARRITSTDSPEWRSLFTDFTRSAFRLETLQHYTAADEAAAFAKFCAGEDPGLDLSWWRGLAQRHTAAGRSMSRVRVVVEPVTDYTRFELAQFPALAAAGDDIRIIAVGPGEWPPGVPHRDFWIFDEQDLWALRYDKDGVLRSAELITDTSTLTEHLRWRDVAMAQAIPVNDYLALPSANRRAS
jgi:hypothetical protein